MTDTRVLAKLEEIRAELIDRASEQARSAERQEKLLAEMRDLLQKMAEQTGARTGA